MFRLQHNYYFFSKDRKIWKYSDEEIETMNEKEEENDRGRETKKVIDTGKKKEIDRQEER